MPPLDTSQAKTVTVPIYRHASETARSKEDAGGEVPTSAYVGKTPGQADQRR